MSTSNETTAEPFLVIYPKCQWISFPDKGADGNWIPIYLTLDDFLKACSNAKPNGSLEEKLRILDTQTPELQKSLFTKFLEVIYQFQQLGL